MAKLDPPFPSSPHRPPVFSLECSRGDKRVYIGTFCAIYAARKFVDAIVDDHDIKWRDEDTIHLPDAGVTIKGKGLEDIMEHKLTAAEKEWELPTPYDKEALFIATGERQRISPKRSEPGEGGSITGRLPQERMKKGKENESERVVAKRTPPTRAPLPDGMIGLAAICEEIGMEPRDARAILRKTHTKPDHGWAWTAADAKKIKSTLSGKDKDDAGDKTPLKGAGNKTAQAADDRKRKSKR